MKNPDRLSRYIRILNGYLFFIVIFLFFSYLGAQYAQTLEKYINFLLKAALYTGTTYLVFGCIHVIVSIIDSAILKKLFLYDFIFSFLGIGIIAFISYILAVISAL